MGCSNMVGSCTCANLTLLESFTMFGFVAASSWFEESCAQLCASDYTCLYLDFLMCFGVCPERGDSSPCGCVVWSPEGGVTAVGGWRATCTDKQGTVLVDNLV